ncbi:hypothetical protein QBC46DRAFT_453966 [Diplogelasinospora grovesii]|uniref:Uncharacterized protein n=1 Tax=Diplogelasinospora grovesii TaxID=303347 RepID=A0AAN6MXL8_9PEZI|nr:hypothetical protein QBC46DRAFT_453966 [Diplogelasinospora grovesii]
MIRKRALSQSTTDSKNTTLTKMNNDKAVYRGEIIQMMYVAGETVEPSLETTTLVESIIRDQVIQMPRSKLFGSDDGILQLATANELATRRGARKFSKYDLIFQIRHDHARVARLRRFLRAKAMTSGKSKGEDGAADLDVEDAEPDEVEDINAVESEEELLNKAKSETPIPALPWDISSLFSEPVPGGVLAEEEAEMDKWTKADLPRLLHIDRRTRNMSAQEYATWVDYRKTSFTRRKKKFTDWSGLGTAVDYKKHDDIMAIFAFLTSEMLHKLVTEALLVQSREMHSINCETSVPTGPVVAAAGDVIFTKPQGVKPPLHPDHIRRAFEKLQIPLKRYRCMAGSRDRRKLRLL